MPISANLKTQILEGNSRDTKTSFSHLFPLILGLNQRFGSPFLNCTFLYFSICLYFPIVGVSVLRKL